MDYAKTIADLRTKKAALDATVAGKKERLREIAGQLQEMGINPKEAARTLEELRAEEGTLCEEIEASISSIERALEQSHGALSSG